MQIFSERMTAVYDGSIVVFLIGMRINHFRKIGKWLPVARAMGPMINELSQDKDSGFLGSEFMLKDIRTIVLLQYWKSFEQLEHYARAKDKEHRPAWSDFNKKIGTDGTVGIFHETYCVPARSHEVIYANMPAFGLGKVTGLVPATGRKNEARQRMSKIIE